jgi:phage terminase large subunit-like protein
VPRAEGNRAKRVTDTSPPPWREWPAMPRHERAITWVEMFCIPPKGYGAGRAIKLADFQKDWLRDVLAPGVTSAAMSLPRGNGKSTFLACVALWALFDEDETGAPQIPVVATTLTQVKRSVYAVAVAMVREHPVLANRSLIFSGIGSERIETPYNHGELFPVSNDPDGLQGLDPSLAVCDEIGFMPTESWGSLLLASGKRPQSLVVGIGTPGFDKHSALWHLRSRVREGNELPGFLFTEYAAHPDCAKEDEDEWRAANPALACGYMNIDALRTAVAISPEAHFRIFRLGQWVDGVSSWLGPDGRTLWQNLCDPYDFVPGVPTWVGVDIGLARDSTAIVWCQRRGERLHVKARVWLPRTDGRLDVSDAMAFIRSLCDDYDVEGVFYDPRLFEFPAQALTDEGLPMLEFPQSVERMTPAVGAVYDAIKSGGLSHDGDQIFEDQVLNAVARMNERGFTLAKSKSKDRIDAAVAMALAVHGASGVKPVREVWTAYA